jgi:NADH-quinone oxidoreductase subunit M
LAATGVILGAAYMLWLYRRVIFGKLTKDDLKSIMDMNRREVAVFTPLLVLTILMGVYPGPFLEIIEVSVANLVDQHKTAMAAVEALSVSGR